LPAPKQDLAVIKGFSKCLNSGVAAATSKAFKLHRLAAELPYKSDAAKPQEQGGAEGFEPPLELRISDDISTLVNWYNGTSRWGYPYITADFLD